MLFSVVTVCLNPGNDLEKTVYSVLRQDFQDFHYVIKDGGSSDGTQFFTHLDPRILFRSKKDDGIYPAMNEAIDLCRGKYILFLNAGDTFYSDGVLSDLSSYCSKTNSPMVVYLNVFNEKLGISKLYPNRLSRRLLFRRPICHQSTYVRRDCFNKFGKFDTSYRILADYDFLCRLIIQNGADHLHCPIIGTSYQDDGFSSHLGNRFLKKAEMDQIRRKYFSGFERLFLGFLFALTFPDLRIWFLNHFQSKILRSTYSGIANLLSSGKLRRRI